MAELINKADAIKVALDFFMEFQGGAFHIEEQKELEKRIRDIQSPLPEKKEVDTEVYIDYRAMEKGYECGWNDCLDKILGEKE